jgi:hypothetical protein
MSVSAHCVTFSLLFSLTGAYYAVKKYSGLLGMCITKNSLSKVQAQKQHTSITRLVTRFLS